MDKPDVANIRIPTVVQREIVPPDLHGFESDTLLIKQDVLGDRQDAKAGHEHHDGSRLCFAFFHANPLTKDGRLNMKNLILDNQPFGCEPLVHGEKRKMAINPADKATTAYSFKFGGCRISAAVKASAKKWRLP